MSSLIATCLHLPSAELLHDIHDDITSVCIDFVYN